jgi:dsRNA-specific ribonuclease
MDDHNYTFVKYPGFKKDVVKELIPLAKTYEINDSKLRSYLITLLTKYGNVEQNIVEELFDDDGIRFIKVAFTHPSMFEDKNYEFYEIMGDVTVNKCIVWYIYRRLPEIRNLSNSAMLMTELKKKYISKKSFSPFCKQLGLDQFIRWKSVSYQEGKYIKQVQVDDSMREDVFEAFFACLEDLIDSRILMNTGMNVVYNIIASLLDQENIVTDLSELVDPKSQLKEVLEDVNFVPYVHSKEEIRKNQLENKKWKVEFELKLKQNICNENIPFTKGYYSKVFYSNEQNKVIEAEKEVAIKVLNWLKSCGFKWTAK